MASFWDLIFGGGDTSAERDKAGGPTSGFFNDPAGQYLGDTIDPTRTNQYKQARLSQGLLGLGAGLGALGPSRLPVPLAQSVASGAKGLMSAQEQLSGEALQAAQTGTQIQEAAKTKVEAQKLGQQMKFLEGLMQMFGGDITLDNAGPGSGSSTDPTQTKPLRLTKGAIAGNDTADTTMEPEQRAFLDTIAGPESKGAYNARWPSKTFDDFSKHPNILEPGPQGPSSAAGRYEFVNSTWAPIQQKLGLPDFGPVSQDRAAWHNASTVYASKTGRDLLADLKSGRTQDIGSALSGQWATLKGALPNYAANFAKYTRQGPYDPSNMDPEAGFSRIPPPPSATTVASAQPAQSGSTAAAQAQAVTPPTAAPGTVLSQKAQYDADIAAGRRPVFPPGQTFNSRGEAIAADLPYRGPTAPNLGPIPAAAAPAGLTPSAAAATSGGSTEPPTAPPSAGGDGPVVPATALPPAATVPATPPAATVPAATTPPTGSVAQQAQQITTRVAQATAAMPVPQNISPANMPVFRIGGKVLDPAMAMKMSVLAMGAGVKLPDVFAQIAGLPIKQAEAWFSVGPDVYKEQMKPQTLSPGQTLIRPGQQTVVAPEKITEVNDQGESITRWITPPSPNNVGAPAGLIAPGGPVATGGAVAAPAPAPALPPQQNYTPTFIPRVPAPVPSATVGQPLPPPVGGPGGPAATNLGPTAAGPTAAGPTGPAPLSAPTLGAPPTGAPAQMAQAQMAQAQPVPETGIRTAISPSETEFRKSMGTENAKRFQTRRDAALDAQASIENSQEAVRLLNQGMVTGLGADARVTFGKMLNAAGIRSNDDPIKNTEAYISLRAGETARIIKAFGSGSGVSDADRAYAQNAAAGNIALNEKSIREILEMSDRVHRQIINRFNREASAVDPKTSQFPLQVDMPKQIFPVRVSSPEQVKALPPGTQWINTDGTHGGTTPAAAAR